MKIKPPDIYLKPELLDIGILDFHKFKEIMSSVSGDVEYFREELKKQLKEKKKRYAIFGI